MKNLNPQFLILGLLTLFSYTTLSAQCEDQFLEAEICEGDSYTLPSGDEVFEEGLYEFELTENGCTYTARLALVVKPHTHTMESRCAEPHEDPGTYQTILEDCVIHVLTLIYHPPEFTSLTGCEGEVLTYKGVDYTEPIFNTDIISIDDNGCEYIEQLNIAFVPKMATRSLELCGSEVFVFQGTEISEPGLHTFPFNNNSAPCQDSIQFNVEVLEEVVIDIELCANSPIPEVGPCEVLNISYRESDVINIQLCEGEPFPEAGECEILNITVTPQRTGTRTYETICEGDSIEWHGMIFHEPTTQAVVLTDANGLSLIHI